MTETNFWDDVQTLDSGLTDGFDLSGLDEILGVGGNRTIPCGEVFGRH